MIYLLIPFALVMSSLAFAQSPADEERQARLRKDEREFWIQYRMAKVRPYRREAPLREDNVSDMEIREIQAAAAAIMPGAIVNIGSVVTGCPCEDGPRCTDQVWIVAYRPDRTMGFLLSRLSDHWAIGIVQRWWWDFENLMAQRENSDEWRAAEKKLMERFPACDEDPESADVEAGSRR